MSSKKKSILPACAACDLPVPERVCFSKKGRGYKGCPSLTRKKVLKAANADYEDGAVKNLAHHASVQEAECYVNRDQKPYIMQPSKTRIVEIYEFAKKMAYKRLGLAFCLGLIKEAKVVEEILIGYGFEVVSVCCKAGHNPLAAIYQSDSYYRKIRYPDLE